MQQIFLIFEWWWGLSPQTLSWRWALNRCSTTVPGALWISRYWLPFVQQITITNLEKCFPFHGFQRVSELFQLGKLYNHPDAELWIWGETLSSVGKIPSKVRSHSFVYRHSASAWIICWILLLHSNSALTWFRKLVCVTTVHSHKSVTSETEVSHWPPLSDLILIRIQMIKVHHHDWLSAFLHKVIHVWVK